MDLSELKKLCEEYEIPNDVFNKIVEEALNLREFNGKVLGDSDIIEIIKLSIEIYDSYLSSTYYNENKMANERHKSIKSTVELAAHKLFDLSPYVDNLPDYDYSEENKYI